MHSSLERAKLFVVGGSFPAISVGLVPFGSIKSIILIGNIISLIGNVVNGFVVNVNTVLGLLDTLLESDTEIVPFLHESLTFWGSKEGLVKFLKVIHFFGVGPSLK